MRLSFCPFTDLHIFLYSLLCFVLTDRLWLSALTYAWLLINIFSVPSLTLSSISWHVYLIWAILLPCLFICPAAEDPQQKQTAAMKETRGVVFLYIWQKIYFPFETFLLNILFYFIYQTWYVHSLWLTTSHPSLRPSLPLPPSILPPPCRSTKHCVIACLICLAWCVEALTRTNNKS